MAVVAGLETQAPTIIATPGIAPYTLIPATDGRPAYTAFLLWRDRHTTSLSSSTYWSHMICPPIKTDNSALDTVCRTFSSKTKGLWGLDANVLKYIKPGGKGRNKKEQKEDITESHSRIRSKIVAGKGTTCISSPQHIIYISPIRYIPTDIINQWCKDDGEMIWMKSEDLFTAFRSDQTNASLVVNTHAVDDVTRTISYPLYLPFSAAIRTPEAMREILEILSQFEATLDTSTTITTTPSETISTPTTTSSNIPTCIYTCRKCRTRLFTQQDVVSHEPQQNYAPIFAGKKRDMVSAIQCSSYFLGEPVKTLGDFSEASGRIVCPNSKCGVRIGDYDWAGSQCSCGAWITPALQITQSKVDRKVNNPTALQHVVARPLPREQKTPPRTPSTIENKEGMDCITLDNNTSSTTTIADDVSKLHVHDCSHHDPETHSTSTPTSTSASTSMSTSTAPAIRSEPIVAQ